MRAGMVITQSLCRGEATPCPKPLRKYVLAVAILGSSLGFIDGTIITVALAPIRDSLDAPFSAMQWVVNAYTLALSAFLLTGGAAGDMFGKRRIFAIGIAVFAAASMLCAIAPTVETLIAARTLKGLGAALMVPGSLALIAVNFPEEERGRAVGIWAAASGITSALGPILGGLLIDLGSWRAVFYINIPFAALALCLLMTKVPADPPRGEGRFDILGAALAFLGVGAVALGFTLAEAAGLVAPLPLIALAAGIVVLVVFVLHQRATAQPMLPLQLFASRTFSVANAETLLVYFALSGVFFFLPITMMEAHGWSATLAGAVFLPFTAVMAVVSPFAGRLADRIGARPLLIAGPLIVAAAFVILAYAAANPSYWGSVFPAMLVFGLGMGLAIPPLSAAILNDAGPDFSGVASGVNNAVARVAGLLAVAILGLVASVLYRAQLGVADGGFAAPIGEAADRGEAIVTTFAVLSLVSSAVCIVAAALAAFLPRRPLPVSGDAAAAT
ncbi:MAG: MFS transporter [Pseudomonadota bacterium]